MRLEEFEQPSAEASRVQRLKDAATQARDKAKQMSAQAKTSADQLKLKQSREKMTQLDAPPSSSTIKPVSST